MRDTRQRKDMLRENCKALLPIMKAYAEGKTIEVKSQLTGKWVELPELKFDNTPEKYRVKAEKEYRPFENGKECWEEMHNHPDFGYIVRDGVYMNVWDIYSDAIHTSEDCDECLYFEDALKEVTFTDGKPFGKEVEE